MKTDTRCMGFERVGFVHYFGWEYSQSISTVSSYAERCEENATDKASQEDADTDR